MLKMSSLPKIYIPYYSQITYTFFVLAWSMPNSKTLKIEIHFQGEDGQRLSNNDLPRCILLLSLKC